MRMSDWSSDFCSSDLRGRSPSREKWGCEPAAGQCPHPSWRRARSAAANPRRRALLRLSAPPRPLAQGAPCEAADDERRPARPDRGEAEARWRVPLRSEEHTSELQSLMRISYAVFCLKKKKQIPHNNENIET